MQLWSQRGTAGLTVLPLTQILRVAPSWALLWVSCRLVRGRATRLRGSASHHRGWDGATAAHSPHFCYTWAWLQPVRSLQQVCTIRKQKAVGKAGLWLSRTFISCWCVLPNVSPTLIVSAESKTWTFWWLLKSYSANARPFHHKFKPDTGLVLLSYYSPLISGL